MGGNTFDEGSQRRIIGLVQADFYNIGKQKQHHNTLTLEVDGLEEHKTTLGLHRTGKSRNLRLLWAEAY